MAVVGTVCMRSSCDGTDRRRRSDCCPCLSGEKTQHRPPSRRLAPSENGIGSRAEIASRLAAERNSQRDQDRRTTPREQSLGLPRRVGRHSNARVTRSRGTGVSRASARCLPPQDLSSPNLQVLMGMPATIRGALASSDGHSALIELMPSEDASQGGAMDLVREIRSKSPESLTGLPGTKLDVGGLPALNVDYADATTGRFWNVVLYVVAVTMVALLIGFRSAFDRIESGCAQPRVSCCSVRRSGPRVPGWNRHSTSRALSPSGRHLQRDPAHGVLRCVRTQHGLRSLPGSTSRGGSPQRR